MFVRSGALIPPLTQALVFAILSVSPAWAAGQKKGGPVAPSKPVPLSEVPVTALTPGYNIKPSDVALPEGAQIGQYRRIFQPFPNWTLVCDENFVSKKKVCNIAQTIVGPNGENVFSWSLAADQKGQPLFILRLPPTVGEGKSVRLGVPDGGPPIVVGIAGCTVVNCLAYQIVSPRLRAGVEKGVAIEVSYPTSTSASNVAFLAPLAGLSHALAAI